MEPPSANRAIGQWNRPTHASPFSLCVMDECWVFRTNFLKFGIANFREGSSGKWRNYLFYLFRIINTFVLPGREPLLSGLRRVSNWSPHSTASREFANYKFTPQTFLPIQMNPTGSLLCVPIVCELDFRFLFRLLFRHWSSVFKLLTSVLLSVLFRFLFRILLRF